MESTHSVTHKNESSVLIQNNMDILNYESEESGLRIRATNGIPSEDRSDCANVGNAVPRDLLYQ